MRCWMSYSFTNFSIAGRGGRGIAATITLIPARSVFKLAADIVVFVLGKVDGARHEDECRQLRSRKGPALQGRIHGEMVLRILGVEASEAECFIPRSPAHAESCEGILARPRRPARARRMRAWLRECGIGPQTRPRRAQWIGERSDGIGVHMRRLPSLLVFAVPNFMAADRFDLPSDGSSVSSRFTSQAMWTIAAWSQRRSNDTGALSLARFNPAIKFAKMRVRHESRPKDRQLKFAAFT